MEFCAQKVAMIYDKMYDERYTNQIIAFNVKERLVGHNVMWVEPNQPVKIAIKKGN